MAESGKNRQRTAATRTPHVAPHAQLNTRITDLNADLNNRLADLRSEMNGRLTDLERDVDNLRTDVRGMGERMRDVEIDVGGINRRLETIEQAIIAEAEAKARAAAEAEGLERERRLAHETAERQRTYREALNTLEALRSGRSESNDE